jgi:hypothetical protein
MLQFVFPSVDRWYSPLYPQIVKIEMTLPCGDQDLKENARAFCF